MIIKILGTGADTSKEPKPCLGKYHPSCLIYTPKGNILIDVGNDILKKCSKQDLLDTNIILITHAHNDAIGGIKILNNFLEENDKIIDIYSSQNVIENIKLRWSPRSLSNYNLHIINAKKPITLNGLTVYPVKVFHDKRFTTFAYNFEKVFFYMSDGGPTFSEYSIRLMSNCILAVIDGAYWDNQIPLNNHIAVLPNLNYILSLNNKYTLFTGMGNQWPCPFSEANKILKEKLEEYKKKHPECKVKEVRTAKEGEKLSIDLNKVYSRIDDFIVKPGLDEVLENPTILQKISKRELLMYHLRLHQWWAVKKSEKVLKAHVLTVKEFFRRGLNHNVVNDLDRKTYRILGREVKIFEIWEELKDEIVIKSNIIRFVGSSLHSAEPNDLDIIAPPVLENIIRRFLEKYNPHFIGNSQGHGDTVNVYDLVLRKKKLLTISNPKLPNYNSSYKLCKLVKKLDLKSDLYVVEPVIEGTAHIEVDKKNRIIYEYVITKEGKKIITDLLAYKKDNLFDEVLINRLYFMHKKWLDKSEPVLLPLRWIVRKENLFSFLRFLSKKYKRIMIRPGRYKYYDGKFIINFNKGKYCCECLNCGHKVMSNKHCIEIKCPKCGGEMRRCDRPGVGKSIKKEETLKPLKVFPPLKATGSSYHKMEYFNPEEAWNFFCDYYVKNEGKVRAEYKVDGWRMIAEQDEDKNTLIYFEDSKTNKKKNFPNVIKELSSLHEEGIILDGELMEWDPENKRWLSRHDLMKWSQSKNPGSDENVRIFVFDCLFYNQVDLHNKPLSERLKVLKEVSKKFKKHFILCPGFDITTKEQLIKKFNYLKNNLSEHKLGGPNGIDGLMLKSYSGVYELDGKTTSWAKLKWSYESDVIILDVNKTDSTYNYLVGYGIPQNKIDKFTPVKELNGKFYGVLGRTFNTKIHGKIGQILNIAAAEYKKKEVNGKIKYTLFQARVITLKPDKKEPDSYLVIDKLSKEKSLSFNIIDKKEPATGQWTIEEGMEGKFCIQIHSRGIKPIFIDYLTKTDLKKFGLDPSHFIPSDKELKKLVSYYDEISIKDWKSAIKEASEPKKSSKTLSKFVDDFLKAVDFKKLPKEIKHTLALLDPVSIHQDLRLVPKGADYFEGGHFTTPGNQFKENRLLKVNEHIHLQFMIKKPHTDEPVRVEEPIVRGPSSWISIGEGTPLIVPPNSIGSTTKNYACFWLFEKGTWFAGRQTSPHGKHFKLFKFKGKLLDGWYIIMYAPIDEGRRIWLFYKPKNQDKYEDEYSRNKQFDIDMEKILKIIGKFLKLK